MGEWFDLVREAKAQQLDLYRIIHNTELAVPTTNTNFPEIIWHTIGHIVFGGYLTTKHEVLRSDQESFSLLAR